MENGTFENANVPVSEDGFTVASTSSFSHSSSDSHREHHLVGFVVSTTNTIVPLPMEEDDESSNNSTGVNVGVDIMGFADANKEVNQRKAETLCRGSKLARFLSLISHLLLVPHSLTQSYAWHSSGAAFLEGKKIDDRADKSLQQMPWS